MRKVFLFMEIMSQMYIQHIIVIIIIILVLLFRS